MGENYHNSSPLPWHQEAWGRLQAAHHGGRLPHALLVTGARGIGKGQFAHALAASMLCGSPNEAGQPCGNCQGCHLFLAGTHPDYTRVVPAEPGKAIRIDRIRECTDQGTLTAQAGGYKVIVVAPADAMNIPAANSLLKTLEEPVRWTLIILVSASPERLPATIRSRCQKLHLPLPPRAKAEQWLTERLEDVDAGLLLDLTSGAPLKALELAESDMLSTRGRLLEEFSAVVTGDRDPVAVAAAWNGLELEALLSWVSGWLVDMVRLKAVPGFNRPINPDQVNRLRALGNRLEFAQLYDLLDRAYEATRSLGSQLNSLMLLEGFLLALADNGGQPPTKRVLR